MNPLRLFDYVFYCIAILYDRVFDYTLSRVESGIAILSFFQVMNVMFIVRFLEIEEKFAIDLRFIYFIITYIVLVGLNFIRYKKIVNYENLTKKLDSQNAAVRILKIILVIIYGITSAVLIGV